MKLKYLALIGTIILTSVIAASKIDLRPLKTIKSIDKYNMECKYKYIQDVTIRHYEENTKGLVMTATRLGANRPFAYFF
ncbi:hypothetical protein CMI40_00365 [Candidatus Pacearchaeota archaeon]|jgi:predicted small secreted protein|nr:hypothetical protein [Candidatus Pacearchaeota archaeon]|tara:strand:+ start:13751 stop:13987 length:237 start_codon:yes stop_codon:yes gene_type:complete